MAKSFSELVGNAEAEAERCLGMFRKYKRLADRWWERYEAEIKKRDRYAKAHVEAMGGAPEAEAEGEGLRDRLAENAAALGFIRNGATQKEVSEAFDRLHKRASRKGGK
jgi:hypothetical protein